MQGRLIKKVGSSELLPLFATDKYTHIYIYIYTLLYNFIKIFPVDNELWSKHEECD